MSATSADRKFELVAFIDSPGFTGFGETDIIYYGSGSFTEGISFAGYLGCKYRKR